MAEAGRGTVQVIRHDEEPTEVVDRFFRQINNPVLTRINATWQGNGETPESIRWQLPTCLQSSLWCCSAASRDAQNGRLEVKGVAAGGREYQEVFDVGFDGAGNVAIAQLWGRAKIKDLANQTYRAETTSLVETITQTALAYRLLSQYTAFVAVSEEVRVDPDGNTRRVEVPVELPDGVSYEGIFGGAPSEADSSLLLGAPRQSANTGASARASGGLNQPASAPPPVPAPLAEDRAKIRRDVESTEEAEEIPAREPEVAPQQLPRLEILRADGLDEEAIANLTQYLQNVAIAPDVEGEMGSRTPFPQRPHGQGVARRRGIYPNGR